MASSARKHVTADDIIAKLGGNGNRCFCPAHNDRNKPNLQVTDAGDGKVLVKCWAGCSQDAVIEALRQRGLWPQSATGRAKPPIRSNGERYDEDDHARFARAMKLLRRAKAGNLPPPTEYLAGRGINIVPKNAMFLAAEDAKNLGGKRFPAMLFPITNSDGHVQGAHLTYLNRDGDEKLATDKPRRMYGTAKNGFVSLGRKPSRGGTVIAGEGIETVLSAMQLSGIKYGVAALSAAGLKTLKLPPGIDAVLAVDNDNAGRRAAAAVAERFGFEGRTVKLATPRAEGADWNDRLRANEAKARREWKAALRDPEAPSDAITALEEDDFMAQTFPERTLLLDPWLPRPGLAMIHAPRGEGKTWLALAIGKAIAAGEDLMSWSCDEAAKVLYVEGELPGASLQDRLKRFDRSPRGMFHILSRDSFLLRKQMIPNLGDPEGRQELDGIIERCQPGVIILDSISTLVRSGVENEAESWAPIQDWLLKHRWASRTVILIHHENKQNKPRGSSKREDVLDTMIGLRKKFEESNDKESVFELTYTKSRDFYGAAAEPILIKLAMPGGKVTWSHERVKDARLAKIEEMLDAGIKQTDIAKELGVTKARVSQLVRELRAA